MKIMKSLPAKLIVGIIIGVVLGLVVPESIMTVIVPVKNILGQIIQFVVPLIVIGFIAPSITKLGNNATRMLGVALVIAYASSVLAAFLSMASGYVIIPNMPVADQAAALRELPADVFGLAIPQIMGVMSALALSYDDPVAPAKVAAKCVEDFKKMELKAGVVDGEFYDKAMVEKLATIPSKEELIAKMLGSMMAPLSGLARVLNAIAENKGGATEAATEAAAE